jgi:hypothetical protein
MAYSRFPNEAKQSLSVDQGIRKKAHELSRPFPGNPYPGLPLGPLIPIPRDPYPGLPPGGKEKIEVLPEFFKK